jgi:hypothetical protein
MTDIRELNYLILEFDQARFNLHIEKLHRKPYFMYSNLGKKTSK